MSTPPHDPRNLTANRFYPEGHYARIHSALLTPSPQNVATAFGVEEGAPVVRRERVHYAEDVVLSLSVSWFAPTLAALCPALLRCERITEGTPAYIGARTGLPAVRRRDIVTAAAAGQAHAEQLGVEAGSPVQLVTSYWLNATGGLMEFGESLSGAVRGITYDYSIAPAVYHAPVLPQTGVQLPYREVDTLESTRDTLTEVDMRNTRLT